MRKSRKSVHLKKNHSEHPLPSSCLADLFIEVTSADECDSVENVKTVGSLENSTDLSSKYYICQHCYCSTSHSWHHGGIDNTFLCDTCRVYYCKYGQMRKIYTSTDPPLHILKDTNHLELIKQINEGRSTLQGKIFNHRRDFSDLSESSDDESNLSDGEKLDHDYPFNEPGNIRNTKNTFCNTSIFESCKIPPISSGRLINDNIHRKKSHHDEHTKSIDCLNLSYQNQECSNMNLQMPNPCDQSSCNLHSPLQDGPTDVNTSILKSLLQSSDEKSSNIR